GVPSGAFPGVRLERGEQRRGGLDNVSGAQHQQQVAGTGRGRDQVEDLRVGVEGDHGLARVAGDGPGGGGGVGVLAGGVHGHHPGEVRGLERGGTVRGEVAGGGEEVWLEDGEDAARRLLRLDDPAGGVQGRGDLAGVVGVVVHAGHSPGGARHVEAAGGAGEGAQARGEAGGGQGRVRGGGRGEGAGGGEDAWGAGGGEGQGQRAGGALDLDLGAAGPAALGAQRPRDA